METVRRLLPELSYALRKGNCGRLGLLGGSAEYTGAPYYAAYSMLRLGADLAHVFTPAAAAPVIKSYSPELIVHPHLESVLEWYPRMDGILIGPGLGREPDAMGIARKMVETAAAQDTPTVVDADGLWAVTEALPGIKLSSDFLILTPNAVEMDRLAQKVMNESTLGKSSDEISRIASYVAVDIGAHIYAKGPIDIFCCPDGKVHTYNTVGSVRRPGGIGDILSGVLLTLLVWAKKSGQPIDNVAEAASFLVRECSRRAFEDKGRGMVASDVLAHVAPLIKHIDRSSL